MGRSTRRLGAAAVLTLACGWLLAAPVTAAFPTDQPNDPNYASAEHDPTCAQKYVGSEQYYFYSFIPNCAKNATDADGAAGMSIDKAWAKYSIGDPHTVIAYVEGGINWHNGAGDDAELANKVYLNRRELPVPCTNTPCTLRYGNSEHDYDVNQDGVFNAADYLHDPRVTDANGNGVIDPEDVITAFSCYDRFNGSLGQLTHPDKSSPTGYDCSNGAQAVDNDGNGYPHDISGWDFYDHQNDPATTDSQYGHANNQQKQAAAQTDNGVGGAGVCPACLLLPVKAGAEALDRTDDLAQAWLFAADSGASVIVSVTADLGYSSFMRQAVESIWRRGVVMVEASNDFDSTDHQGGMWWPFVLPGNGLVANTDGMDAVTPAVLAANLATTTFRDRSGYTSWGAHNMFSASNEGGTTSESTPTVGGVMGLVMADGRRLDPMLSGPEAVQLVRATASTINDATTPGLNWSGNPSSGDWNLQYGYGRPDVLKAMEAIQAGAIPPVGWIDRPDWFSLYDPTTTRYVPITGHVEARRASGYTWQLQYALGAEPSPSAWNVISSGSGSKPFDGTLGSLDLSRIPRSFWSAPYGLSKTKTLESSEQYSVTLRLVVTDTLNRMGEDRRTIDVVHDPTWRGGFPLRIGHGGDSQPALVDLQGAGRLDIVFADSDGLIHAIDPVTLRELPGWPAHTDAVTVQKPHAGIDPGHEAVFAPVAVGDLDHDGRQWVVATSSEGRVYVFDSRGQLRPGWPQALADDVSLPAIPRPADPMTRFPHMGAADSPVLYDLGGDGRLEIVQSGWDGHVHIWNPDASVFADWAVQKPDDSNLDPGAHWIQDHKLESSPVIANLTGNGPDLVIRSQWTETMSTGSLTPGGAGFLHAYTPQGRLLWVAKMPGIVEYYGSAQEFITEGANAPVAADVFGDGQYDIASGPILSPTYLFHGDGNPAGIYGPLPGDTLAALQGTIDPAAVLAGRLPTDAPVGFTTSGAFATLNGVLTYVQPGTGGGSLAAALLLPGSGLGINEYERAFTAAGGAPVPGFPALMQGLDFLGTPAVADVTGDGQPEILQGADSSALMGFSATGGAQAAGFPKVTTGWSVWAPAVGDVATGGHNDVVMLTREGYLFDWATPGLASADSEWWTYRHDEHRTNQYGLDTRPPGALRDIEHSRQAVTFVDPGDDWYSGTADHIHAVFEPSGTARDVVPAGAAGSKDAITAPAGTTSVTLQAVDKAGNLGLPSTVSLQTVGPMPPATGGGTPSRRTVAAVTPDGPGRPLWLIPVAAVALALGLLFVPLRRRT